MDIKDKFEAYVNDISNIRSEKIKEIRAIRDQQRTVKNLKQSIALGNRIDVLIDDVLRIENTLRIIRVPSEEDIQERLDIANNFENNIKDISTPNYRVIYKGIDNIDTVENIIRNKDIVTISSGDYYNSDEIAKAEPGIESFCPYGAIFVFTLRNTDRYSSFELRKDAYLLSAVITTNENKDRLIDCCSISGLDKRKIMNHEEFVTYLKGKYERANRGIVL